MSELRIMDLVRSGKYGPQACYMVGTVQREAYAKAGHLLMVYNPSVWRELKKACRTGELRKIEITCYRCLAVGTLNEWLILCTEGKAGYGRMVRAYGGKMRDRLAKMAHMCQGDAIAEEARQWIIGEIEARWEGKPAPIPELQTRGGSDGTSAD